MKRASIILFFLLIFTSNAYAKINYNGKPIKDDHISVIKGLAYDIICSNTFDDEKERQKVLSKFAHAILWLIQHHNSKNLYELKSFEGQKTKHAYFLNFQSLNHIWPLCSCQTLKEGL